MHEAAPRGAVPQATSHRIYVLANLEKQGLREDDRSHHLVGFWFLTRRPRSPIPRSPASLPPSPHSNRTHISRLWIKPVANVLACNF